MLAVKDEPIWWLIEHITGEGAGALGQYFFGPIGAVLATVAVAIAFDAHLNRGQERPSAEPSANVVRVFTRVMAFVGIVIAALVGVAFIWAVMSRTFPVLEPLGQAGGMVAAAIAAVCFYLLVRSEIRN